jgi:hypothetical protein
MFIATLFTSAKLWKQPGCPTTNEWIKKMWYLYTMEFYLATKKNEILSFIGKWIELKYIILSKVSQVQTAKSHLFSLIDLKQIQQNYEKQVKLRGGHIQKGESKRRKLNK